MSATINKKPNKLINETSPYLLQHAYNPVNWVPFSEEAFKTARKENKPVIISIGYSACHWCHVMEHESFEDEEVARLMNEHFICIKVDREERSDVDMLYMQAVQLMTGHGGWPLNCFVLPDGRPFYGGTYFRKQQWMHILSTLSNLYRNDPAKVNEFAGQLTDGIKQAEQLISKKGEGIPVSAEVLKESVAKWKKQFDNVEGGPNRAPKFPLPSNYLFLLRYGILNKDDSILKHVNLTLTKMAFGGIYDQLNGGFARYSTDIYWKVPHFEKMLYDNSQLVSLYCEAYTLTGNELYKEIAEETLQFVTEEWYNDEGNFYSALDADSDGEEGKYYVWTKEDLKELLGDKFGIFSDYYKINEESYWEHGNYILMRQDNVAKVMATHNLGRQQLKEKINECRLILKQEAKSRIKPGLDDKTITSWNAMMCTAYAKAYLCFNDDRYKKIALGNIGFLLNKMVKDDNRMLRAYKKGEARIDAFLDDYAFMVEALIHAYLISQDENYLNRAREINRYALVHFQNNSSDFFYYTHNDASDLITRITETSDNVIPSSNSQMAMNLFYLGHYFSDNEWIERAERMLSNLSEEIKSYGAGYSNWGCLALHFIFPFKEIAIVGNNVDEKLRKLYNHGITNAIFAVHASRSDLPLLMNREVSGKTMIYVCENSSCKLPVETVNEALEQIG
jgi:uncharacterized protein